MGKDVASPRRRASSHSLQQIRCNRERGCEPWALANRMHTRGIPTMDGYIWHEDLIRVKDVEHVLKDSSVNSCYVEAIYARPNAHATINRNSFRQNAPPCDPTRSFMTTSAPASRSAVAHLVAFLRKNGSCVPATRYVRGICLGIASVGL